MATNKNQHANKMDTMDHYGNEEEFKWTPTKEAFQEYVARDYQLAIGNVQGVLSTRMEMSFRELRDSLLHSSETTEQVLTDLIRAGNVKESKNRFTLVKHT